jgi:hypothetical protein
VVSGFDPKSEIAQRFFGAWRYVTTNLNGKPRPGRGDHPKGVIIYDPSGFMAVHIAPEKGVAKAGAEPTAGEALDVIKGTIAYCGTFSIDERAGTVTHHRHASIQPGDVGDAVRRYEFNGNRLILRPVDRDQEIVWERVR